MKSTKSSRIQITVSFVREFTKGNLKGLTHHDKITCVDRWHAAQWIKGIRRNSRAGKLEYKLIAVQH